MVASSSSSTNTPAGASHDGKPVTQYAARCPLFKKTGDSKRDNELHVQRTCLMRIIDACLKEPRYITNLHAHLLSGGFDDTSTKDGVWKGGYGSIERIPKQWVAEYILVSAQQRGVAVLNKEMVRKLESDDADNLMTLLEFILQLPRTMSLPPQCSDSGAFTSMVFGMREEEVGGRLSKFASAGGITAAGKLNWAAGGCFSLTFAEGKCTQIQHCMGAAIEPPAHTMVTTAFLLKDNHLDHRASLSLPPSHFAMSAFFAEDTAFRLTMYKTGKKFKNVAHFVATAESKMASLEKERVGVSGEGSADVLQPAAEKRAKESLEKARAKLAERKTTRDNKRTLKLT